MTCRQLGGACDEEFQASTFEEISELAKQHGIEMFKNNDEAHLNAMKIMQELMQTPESMEEWFENKRIEFSELPED